MVRWIAVVGMLVLLVSAWLMFEIVNIWPFNDGRIEDLRSIFALGVTATIFAFVFGRSRILPPALIASTFVSTTIYSNAVITTGYIVSAAVIVALVAALGWALRPPLYVR
jgi:hypothetical protein